MTAKLRSLQESVGKLEKMLDHSSASTHAEAKYLCEKVLPGMADVRTWADALEAVVADDQWALPSYQEMLFIR